MTDAPVTYRDYYRRWVVAFWRDLWRLGKEQMIGALLAILIFAFQWEYGLIPQHHGWQAVKSIGWPYLILLVLLTLISALRAPVTVDRERKTEAALLLSENARFQETISEQAENAKRLSEENADLKKPKRPAAEQHHYDEAEKVLQGTSDNAKTVLRCILTEGGKIYAGSPLERCSGLDPMVVLDTLKGELLVNTPFLRFQNNTNEVYWEIKPGYQGVLGELLFDMPANSYAAALKESQAR